MNSENKPRIGFIGMGLMGSAMVKRLQSLDYQVTTVAHRNRGPIEEAVARGAVEVTTPAEVAKASDIIMLCVDTTAAVETVMRGKSGVLEQLREKSLVIDFGTSLPGSTRLLAQECAAKGASMMDAPLGRTPVQAVDGLLNIMAAGEERDFNRAKPVLDDLGENVFHVGPIGAGHTLKLINNFFAMTTASAMSEAFAMADLAGLKREMLYSVMAAGPLKSGMMDFIKAGAIDNDPGQLAFSLANGLKDVGYYSSMADDLKVPSFISPAVKNTLGIAVASGWGDKYVPELVDFIADLYSTK
ncbi:MAG: NAD(P)-dependent oxidoreductase [Desulfocapsaceae bacterium]|jgi:2-hydroxy-3-oxopropionate reductase|nr:NAD(P)-dependent oxidoreductase [Desulfocapsaceae bacterium]